MKFFETIKKGILEFQKEFANASKQESIVNQKDRMHETSVHKVKAEETIKQEESFAIKFSANMLNSGLINTNIQCPQISDVILKLGKVVALERDEFESSSAFQLRKNSALKDVMHTDSLEGSFVFATNVSKRYPDGDSGLRYDFNADTCEVRLYALPSKYEQDEADEIHEDIDADIDMSMVDIFDLNVEGNPSNSIRTRYTSNSIFGIAFKRIPFLKMKRETIYKKPSAAKRFHLTNERAALELPKLKALFILNAIDPYTINFTTMGSSDNLYNHYYLIGNLQTIVFFSGITGEIFCRLPVEDEPSEIVPT